MAREIRSVASYFGWDENGMEPRAVARWRRFVLWLGRKRHGAKGLAPSCAEELEGLLDEEDRGAQSDP